MSAGLRTLQMLQLPAGESQRSYLSDGTWQRCGRSERGSWAERGASWPPPREPPSQLPSRRSTTARDPNSSGRYVDRRL